MCGLVGIREFTDAPVKQRELARMLDRVRHRGPDDMGLHIDNGIALGHTRLSILDLTQRAAQPMTSRCGRFTIVYNGEIYNFRCLRDELERQRVNVTSSGDTEVLLECLAAFGVDDTLPRLEGFFAFALWDRKQRQLTLARDRHGIKPLYYVVSRADEVRFASETKALLDGEPQVDQCTFDAVLLGGGETWGAHTLYRGIRRVQPGEVLTFDKSTTPRTRRFFTLTDFLDPQLYEELCGARDEEIVDRLADAFERSVRMRMISDAPVGCLASGGVDSSLIAAIAMRHNPDLRLYHADVAHNSERAEAERLAAHLGTELRTVHVDDARFLETLASVTYHNDAPIIYHPNSVPFYAVSELASGDGVKVLLTGEGSDEYFLGYPGTALRTYLDLYRKTLGSCQKLAHWCFPRAARLLLPRRCDDRAVMMRRLLFRFKEELVNIDSAAAVGHIRNRRERQNQITSLCLLQPHLATLLHRNDRLAMAWGIESRFPFLGHDVARLGMNLPGRMKLRHSWKLHNPRHPFVVDKWCIRKIAQRYLPRPLAARPKKGFPVSTAERLRVAASFFHDGFIAESYGLTHRAINHLMTQSTREWISHLFFAEVWAQLFMMRCSCEEVRTRIHRCTRIETSADVEAADTGAAARRPEPALT